MLLGQKVYVTVYKTGSADGSHLGLTFRLEPVQAVLSPNHVTTAPERP